MSFAPFAAFASFAACASLSAFLAFCAFLFFFRAIGALLVVAVRATASRYTPSGGILRGKATFDSRAPGRDPATIDATMTVRRLVLVAVGALAAFMLLGFGLTLTGYVAPTDAPPPHVISGTFTLVDDATAANGCVGPDGNWRDVRPGATVWVKYGAFLTRSGSLGDGVAVTWGQFDERACAYEFSVGVPDAESYTIDYPGGLSLDYTFEELQSRNWHVAPACCDLRPAG